MYAKIINYCCAFLRSYPSIFPRKLMSVQFCIVLEFGGERIHEMIGKNRFMNERKEFLECGNKFIESPPIFNEYRFQSQIWDHLTNETISRTPDTLRDEKIVNSNSRFQWDQWAYSSNGFRMEIRYQTTKRGAYYGSVKWTETDYRCLILRTNAFLNSRTEIRIWTNQNELKHVAVSTIDLSSSMQHFLASSENHSEVRIYSNIRRIFLVTVGYVRRFSCVKPVHQTDEMNMRITNMVKKKGANPIKRNGQTATQKDNGPRFGVFFSLLVRVVTKIQNEKSVDNHKSHVSNGAFWLFNFRYSVFDVDPPINHSEVFMPLYSMLGANGFFFICWWKKDTNRNLKFKLLDSY